MTLARDVSKFEIEFHQLLHPVGLFLVQFLCDSEVHKVVMVSVNDSLVWVPYEAWSPGQKSVDNGKKFLVINVPVSLHGIEGSGKESDGMELAFLIPLLKDGADSISGGVTINCELIVKTGLS